jgi:2-amino-4-hydroxy-6-hydroxymethyldihydropteridine diphosphokinase
MTGERQIVLALGSNLGDRLGHLQAGIDDLLAGPGLTATAVSGVYQTTPVGGPPQPDYLNAVLLAASSLPARTILDLCLATERASGRVRTVTWGPRTLDIDVIACGAEMSDDPELTLPHPRAHERVFVLVPWLQADPDASLPGYGPVADLLARLDGAADADVASDANGAGAVMLVRDATLRIAPPARAASEDANSPE